jgi:glycosyltransferase involved in cell wall biosynthesis
VRIAFITRRMILGYGVDLAIHELARRLVSRGHSVDVWTPTADGTYSGQPYRVREFVVPGKSMNRALPIFEYHAYRSLRSLAAQLRENGEAYDILIPCTHPYYGAGQAFGQPQVFYNFGNVPHIGFGLKQRLNYSWLDLSEDLLHKRASLSVVSISEFLHAQQPLEIQRRGQVVYLGGDHYLDERSAQPQGRARLREEFRARYGIAQQAYVLGYCTRLHRQHALYKGSHELLEIGRRVKKLHPQVETLLAGAGSPADEAWVRGEWGIPAANLPPEDMAAFYCAIDMYVCPSKWEGFNLPLLEAAHFNVPSIAYNIGAHAEIAPGLLVDEVSMDELGRAVVTLIRDAHLRGHFQRSAHSRAEQFTWENSAAQFEELLLSLPPGRIQEALH